MSLTLPTLSIGDHIDISDKIEFLTYGDKLYICKIEDDGSVIHGAELVLDSLPASVLDEEGTQENAQDDGAQDDGAQDDAQDDGAQDDDALADEGAVTYPIGFIALLSTEPTTRFTVTLDGVNHNLTVDDTFEGTISDLYIQNGLSNFYNQTFTFQRYNNYERMLVCETSLGPPATGYSMFASAETAFITFVPP